MANERDCENCKHHREVRKNGKFYRFCESWDCGFEPKEDAEPKEGGQGMTKEEKEAVLHCLRAMIDEELCEECPLYGTTGTDHCEKDCVRLAIEELEQEPRKIALEDVKGYCEPRCLTIISNELLYELTHPKIKELEQKPCEDAISRKAVLNTLENMDRALDEDRTVESYKELLRECYKVLPSVTPKPKSECEHDHEILKAYSDGANAVLDNVRAEIESKYESIPSTFHHYETGFTDALEWVLSIIDKYKAEGSGEK